jgi:hypothetical protein
MEKIGGHIKKFRKAHGLSQIESGEKLGVDPAPDFGHSKNRT